MGFQHPLASETGRADAARRGRHRRPNRVRQRANEGAPARAFARVAAPQPEIAVEPKRVADRREMARDLVDVGERERPRAEAQFAGAPVDDNMDRIQPVAAAKGLRDFLRRGHCAAEEHRDHFGP